MTDTEQLELNARVIERNRPFEAAMASPDFIEWQKAGPVAEMELIKTQIVTVDRSDPLWKERIAEMVISYQAISRVIMGTVVGFNLAMQSRERMKDLGKK